MIVLLRENMNSRSSHVSILRPLAIVVAAFLLALGLERFGLPSISFSLSAPDSVYRLIYSELRGAESTLWLADPADPMARRRSLLTVNHQNGYGVVASVSEDGASLAYAFLPVGRRNAFSEGQLWVSTISGEKPRLISSKVDLHIPPVWSPDGARIVFKTVQDLPSDGVSDLQPIGQQVSSSLVVINVDDPTTQRIVVTAPGLGLNAIGWSQDSSTVFFNSFDLNSSEVGTVDVQTVLVSGLGRIADEPTWNVRLSPDKARLLFSTGQRTESGNLESLWMYEMDSRGLTALSGPDRGPVGAAWHPSRTSFARNDSHGSGQRGQAVSITRIEDQVSDVVREEPSGTTSVPISWAPDGSFLAVRHRSLMQSGDIDRLAVLDPSTGQMRQITGDYAQFVGWTNKAK